LWFSLLGWPGFLQPLVLLRPRDSRQQRQDKRDSSHF
jgi:hypothetical protein